MDNSRPIIKSKSQRRREAAARREAAVMPHKIDITPVTVPLKVHEAPAPTMTPAQIQMMIDAAVKAALAAAPAAPAAPVIQTLDREELRRLLVIEEARLANEASQSVVITPNPTDTSHLPPVGERRSISIQAPARKWGNPAFAAGFKLS